MRLDMQYDTGTKLPDDSRLTDWMLNQVQLTKWHLRSGHGLEGLEGTVGDLSAVPALSHVLSPGSRSKAVWRRSSCRKHDLAEPKTGNFRRQGIRVKTSLSARREHKD